MTDLERFDETFVPQSRGGGNKYDLTKLPDGEMEFTVLCAELTKTPKRGDTIFRLDLQIDTGGARGQVAEKVYFFDDPSKVDQLGADLLKLGFPTDTWNARHGKRFSQEFPRAVRRMRGLRFKAMKQNSDPDSKGKVYGNLYLVNRIGDIPPEAPESPPAPIPGGGGGAPRDPSCPF